MIRLAHVLLLTNICSLLTKIEIADLQWCACPERNKV